MHSAHIVRASLVASALEVLAGPALAGPELVAYAFGRFLLYGAQPATGCYPVGGLLATADPSVFYGATAACGILPDGKNGGGTLYRLERRPGSASTRLTTLFTFDPFAEGYQPRGIPITDGTSLFGIVGTVVYQWTPLAGSVQGRLTILHSFSGSDDGLEPEGALYRDAGGTLYGTTAAGPGGQRGGTVFSLTPPPKGQTGWTYRIIHAFNGADGINPGGTLIGDAKGRLYGATATGGPAGKGTVFALSPPIAGESTWTETVLADFGEADAPKTVNTPLLRLASGALDATSQEGGPGRRGTVFRLTPPTTTGAGWTTTILYSFDGGNGRTPYGPVTADHTGTLFGTTMFGGVQDIGTVFSLAPPTGGTAPWTYADLHDFKADYRPRGAYPSGTLSLTANGFLLGVTGSVTYNNSGVIYLLSN